MRTINFQKINKLLITVVGSAFLFAVPQVYADWDSGGPPGGNVNSMAMAATNPDILYAGTDRGIFKSIDGGTNWTKTGFSEALVRAVQVAPNNADIVYAGTDFGGPPVPTEDGIYKSEDGGTTWTPKGLTGARVTRSSPIQARQIRSSPAPANQNRRMLEKSSAFSRALMGETLGRKYFQRKGWTPSSRSLSTPMIPLTSTPACIPGVAALVSE